MKTIHKYTSFLSWFPDWRSSVLALAVAMLLSSCKKFVTIKEPINSITTSNVFSTDEQANSAMAGVFTQMINGKARYASSSAGYSCGLATLLGSSSSDELVYYSS